MEQTLLLVVLLSILVPFGLFITFYAVYKSMTIKCPNCPRKLKKPSWGKLIWGVLRSKDMPFRNRIGLYCWDCQKKVRHHKSKLVNCWKTKKTKNKH